MGAPRIIETLRSLLNRWRGRNIHAIEQAEAKEECGPTRACGGPPPPPPPPYPYNFQQMPPSLLQNLRPSEPVRPEQTISLPASNSRGLFGPLGAKVCSKAEIPYSISNGQSIIDPVLGVFAVYYDGTTAEKFLLSHRPRAQAYDAPSLVASGVQLRRQIGSTPNQEEFIAELERLVIKPARLVVIEKRKHKKKGLKFLQGLERLRAAEEICRLDCYSFLGLRVRLTVESKDFWGIFDGMDDDRLWVNDLGHRVSTVDLVEGISTIESVDQKETAT